MPRSSPFDMMRNPFQGFQDPQSMKKKRTDLTQRPNPYTGALEGPAAGARALTGGGSGPMGAGPMSSSTGSGPMSSSVSSPLSSPMSPMSSPMDAIMNRHRESVNSINAPSRRNTNTPASAPSTQPARPMALINRPEQQVADDSTHGGGRRIYQPGELHADNPIWKYLGKGLWMDTNTGGIRTSDQYGTSSPISPGNLASEWQYDGRDYNSGVSRWKNTRTGQYYVGVDDPDTQRGGKATDWERVGTDPISGLPLWRHKRSSELRMGRQNPAGRNYDWASILGGGNQGDGDGGEGDGSGGDGGGGGGSGTGPGYDDPFEGFSDYESKIMEQFGLGSDIALNLAQTGGITDAMRKAVRGRAGDVVTGQTDALSRAVLNRKAITGGGITYDNVSSRIQDQGARTGSAVQRDTELGLGQAETGNRLAALSSLFGGNQAAGQFLLGKGNERLNWANLVRMQELGRGQLQNSRIGAIASLLGANYHRDPGVWDYISQILGAVGPVVPDIINQAGGK